MTDSGIRPLGGELDPDDVTSRLLDPGSAWWSVNICCLAVNRSNVIQDLILLENWYLGRDKIGVLKILDPKYDLL